MVSRIKNYFSGAKQEFKAIQWPTFVETRRLTLIVITLAIVTAFFLGVFDFIFAYVLGIIL